MNSIEQNEAALEKLIESLQEDMETRTRNFSAKDIAMFSGVIPDQETMLEFRAKRAEFLQRLEKIKVELVPHFYFAERIQKVLEPVNLRVEASEHIVSFFEAEMRRIAYMREKINSRFSDPDLFVKCERQIGRFMESLGRGMYRCQTALQRLESRTTVSYRLRDVITVIRGMFLSRGRECFLKTVAREVKMIPVTCRSKVIEDCFLRIEKDLAIIGQNKVPNVPFLLKTIEDLDADLVRLAGKYGVHKDIRVEDGQLFLHHSGQLFDQLWTRLALMQRNVVKVPSVGPKIAKTQWELVDEVQYEGGQADTYVKHVVQRIEENGERTLALFVKEYAQGYNQLVGIKANNRLTNGLLKRNKAYLPDDRLQNWVKLRIMNEKFLLNAILSHYNFFEAIKQNLYGGKYRWGPSPDFPQLIAVYDGDKEIVFESAINSLEELKKRMMVIVSRYAREYEVGVTDLFKKGVVDREKMVEMFLELELRFCNAKRQLVQPLFETTVHLVSDEIIKHIFSIISQRPKYRLSLYKMFDLQYEIAISVMEKKAWMIYTLLNLQIFTERRIGCLYEGTVPAFYNAAGVTNVLCERLFTESLPISPFEVYPFLTFLGKFLVLVEEVALELAENIDLKHLHFLDYMEFSVLQTVEQQISKFSSRGYFPFDYGNYPFKLELSDSVFALMGSPYLNDVHAVEGLIESVSKARRLRFALGFIRFLEVGWKLQDLMLRSDHLQHVYLSQASASQIPDPRVYLHPFRDLMNQEVIEVQGSTTSERTLEFGLVDFEDPEFNFADPSFVKNYISSFKFEKLVRLLQFQKLHCLLLDIATRYNSVFLDSQFIVRHFGMKDDLETSTEDESEDIDLFLTQAAGLGEAESAELMLSHDTFMRSLMAGQILLESQNIMKEHRKATSELECFFLNIKQLKSDTRKVISACVKQKEYSDQELYDFYISEILEAFSASAYRYEIAEVCRVERKFLLGNTYTDVFLLESSTPLVNEAGRVGTHFAVPSWADTYLLVRTAPIPRQSEILKTVLNHIVAMFEFVTLVRFETAVQQKKPRVFQTIWEGEFHLETPVFQRLWNELLRLPSGNEFDVSSQYLRDKCLFLFERLQLALLHCFEKGNMSIDGADQILADTALMLYEHMKTPLTFVKGLLTSKRFIPNWTDTMLGECEETVRSEIIKQLAMVDERLDNILSAHQLHSVLESSQAISVELEFFRTALFHFRLKLCIFKMLDGVRYFSIDDPFTTFKPQCYVTGMAEWANTYIPEAAKLMKTQKEENIVVVPDTFFSETKVLQSEIDVARGRLDQMMLAFQVEGMEKLVAEVSAHFTHPSIKISRHKPNVDERPLREAPQSVNKLFYRELHTCRWMIVDILMKNLAAITSGKLIDGKSVEKLALDMSFLLDDFTMASIEFESRAWMAVYDPFIRQRRLIEEEQSLAELFAKSCKKRFSDNLAVEVATMLTPSLLEINKYEDMIRERKHSFYPEDQQSEHETRCEFDKLVFDLEAQKHKINAAFKQREKKVYERVLGQIDKARLVKFENKLRPDFTPHSEVLPDNSIMDETEEDISWLRQEMIIVRLARIFSYIASQRFYSKRIQSYEQDRLQDRAKLWESRREFHTIETQLRNSLQEAYQKLAASEIEIESLKQQLEKEKQATIQLVYYKATNSKKEQQLKDDLDKLKHVDDTDIGELLTKLATARETVQKLREETDEMDMALEQAIRGPMKKAEQLRRRIVTSKMRKAETLRARTMSRPQTAMSTTDRINALIYQYQDENVQLQSKNETLAQQIEAIEIARSQMAPTEVAYLQDIVPNAPETMLRAFQSQKSTPRAITRPKTSYIPRRNNPIYDPVRRVDSRH